MKCPESIEELQELEKMIPLCKVTLYEQAKARIETGAAKSVSEAARQIAEETGKGAETIRRAIQRQQETATVSQLPELAGTDKHRPPEKLELTEYEKEIIEKKGKSFHQEKRALRQSEIQKIRDDIKEQAETIPLNERWNVECNDIENWQPKKQYDFIVTDPPYPKEYIHLYEALAIKSALGLKDGGLLIVMCGQSYINQIYRVLDEHLTYYWTASYLTPGQPKPLRQVNVNTSWKPLLIYRKGVYTGKIFGDVFKSDANEKDFHAWGQSVSGMYDIVSKICLPGQHICDPFMGAGTTGVAALKQGCLFDGIDIDNDCVKIAKVRLNDETNTKKE